MVILDNSGSKLLVRMYICTFITDDRSFFFVVVEIQKTGYRTDFEARPPTEHISTIQYHLKAMDSIELIQEVILCVSLSLQIYKSMAE